MQNTVTLEAMAKVPAFSAILREMESAQLAERQAAIDALETFRAQWHAEAADLHGKALAAKAKLDEARAQMEDAERASDEANARCLSRATSATQRERRLEAAIVATADPRIAQFMAWASRAANLAALASHEAPAAFAGKELPSKSRQAREACRLCAEANERADEMRREAIAAEDVRLELDALAANILQALDRVGGSATARLPRDWQARLI